MAFLDTLTPRFALPRSEAPAALRRMVRVFLGPELWDEGERQIDQRFARGELQGLVTGEMDARGEHPSTIAWKPFEASPNLSLVEVSTRRFGTHLVDMITIEHQTGCKVQPFPHGFRLEKPMGFHLFETTLAEVLQTQVDILGHMRWKAKLRLCTELFGGFRQPKDALAYHAWRTTLPQQAQLRLRAACDFVQVKRRARAIIERMGPDRPALAGGVAALLQEGGGFSAAEAASLADQLLDHFPADLDWQVDLYTPLRIPIETDWLAVDYAYGYGIRGGLPYVPANEAMGSIELVLHPDTTQPLLQGIYDRQCLILDAVDEIRKAFRLPPDARYDHYRSQALRD